MERISSGWIGEAGELRVASELILRGYKPAKHLVDEGIDLTVDNGVGIQVKTVKTLAGSGSGQVCLRSARYKKGRKANNCAVFKADFLIIWVIPKGEFYIIPKSHILSMGRVLEREEATPPKAIVVSKRLLPFKDNWDVLWKNREV